MFSYKFDSGDEEESQKGEGDGPACLLVSGGLYLIQGFGIAPRPHFHQRTDDEAGKNYERLLMPAG